MPRWHVGHGIRAARTGAVIAGGRTQRQDRLPCWQGRNRAASGTRAQREELPLESWEQAIDEDWLGQWAMNLMLINRVDAPSSGVRYGCPRGTFQRRRGAEYRSRRPRATSSRSRRHA